MAGLRLCGAFAHSVTVREPPRRSDAGVVPQFSRFVIVGASNTAISFVAYAALIWLGVFYWLAGPLSFMLGAANGYRLNRRWTFTSPDTGEARFKYLIVQLGGLAAITALLGLLVSWGAVDSLAAYALAVPAVTLGTFLANRGWVFPPGRR
jgi:putative flippase GtrA